MFATKLSDLDDFITPSQECVKMILPSSSSDPSKPGSTVSAKVNLDDDMVINLFYNYLLLGLRLEAFI